MPYANSVLYDGSAQMKNDGETMEQKHIEHPPLSLPSSVSSMSMFSFFIPFRELSKLSFDILLLLFLSYLLYILNHITSYQMKIITKPLM